MFEKDNTMVKHRRHLQKNVFLHYSPKKLKIERASCKKIGTEITAFLPKNSKGFFTSKFRSDKINELFNGKQHLWVEILNKSFEDHIEIKKGLLLNLKTYNFTMYRRKKRQKRKKRVESQKRKRQTEGVLNHYDFTYAGREIVNQAAKVAPGVIRGATNYINSIAKQRIDQISSQGGKEIEHVLPKVLTGAIEYVYQTPSRLLRNFGVQQLNKLKITILN